MKRILILFFCLFQYNGYCQEKVSITTERVTLNKTDYNLQFYVCKDCVTKVNKELYYYWFKANEMLITKGGFEGKLLHGQYIEYYISKNLKSKGNFLLGLKNGEWIDWYENGEIKEINNWNLGKKHGKYIQYSKQGKIISEGAYKNGLLNGTIKVIKEDTVSIKKYKNGIQILEKKDPFKKIKIYKIKKNKLKTPNKDEGIKGDTTINKTKTIKTQLIMRNDFN